MKFLFVEGNIGSGKSTLIQSLVLWFEFRNYKVVCVDEPIGQWKACVDKSGVNYFERFYKNQQENAFVFQLMCMTSRVAKLKRTIDKYKNEKNVVVICERSIESGNEIFGQLLVDEGKMTSNEQLFIKNNTIDFNIDDEKVVLFIDTSIGKCIERISARNRDGEDLISREYLYGLEKKYKNCEYSIKICGNNLKHVVYFDTIQNLHERFPVVEELIQFEKSPFLSPIQNELKDSFKSTSTSLSPIAFDVFPKLEKLQLHNCNFTIINSNMFAGMSNLTILDLSNNQLEKLEPNAFDGLTNLKMLNLNGNVLKKLIAFSFNGLTNVQKIDLGCNELHTIERDAFHGLNKLETLYLNSNKLIELDALSFSGCDNLIELDLDNNDLKGWFPTFVTCSW
jgi:deoxyadenosine/deoxycytidine kinase